MYFDTVRKYISIQFKKFFQRNYYYVIDSNEPIINFINMNNFRRSPKSINTYDFSTVYTSIPHTQLKENMKKFFFSTLYCS